AVAESAYADRLRRIDAARIRLSEKLCAADDETRRRAALSEAGIYLEATLVDSIWPAWMGTPWEFSGTTEVPGEGTIACGYFVTTTLRDAGFDLPRVELARLASEVMIRRLADPADVRRYSDTPIVDFVQSVTTMGDGIYIVGLDCHVGFLLVGDGGVRFCHCSYVSPRCVTLETASESWPLVSSRYRVVGKIIPVSRITEAWLSGRRMGEE
ncbi:MAG: hypothetical protein KJ563_07555, partial [Candidatus Thermoplasmatota archaeon]|nr:hypothetical protein [Candidatus Thermoplasmatota archaeon]